MAKNANDLRVEFDAPERSTSLHSKVNSPLAIPKAVRTVIYYNVYDTEMGNLSEKGWLSSLFFSLASGLFLFTLGARWDCFLSEKIPDAKQQLIDAVCRVGGWASLACLILAIVLVFRRAQIIKHIREQHKHEGSI